VSIQVSVRERSAPDSAPSPRSSPPTTRKELERSKVFLSLLE
jgi:hypothetical protein